MSALDSDWNALVRKYQTLNDLRHGAMEQDPELLRSLSSEFPGALRELDVVSNEALRERLADALDATGGEPPKTWLRWMSAYHRLMRLVLTVRRHLLSARAQQEAVSARVIALRVEAETGERFEPELVPAVLNPPEGRLNRLVFDLLGQRFQCSGDELCAVLFPALAPRPPAAEDSSL